MKTIHVLRQLSFIVFEGFSNTCEWQNSLW